MSLSSPCRPSKGPRSRKLQHVFPPPVIPDPYIGPTPGNPLHICAGSNICLVCQTSEPLRTSSRVRTRNLRLNVCTALATTTYQHSPGPSRTLALSTAPLEDTNFTLQRSNIPGDSRSLLFFYDEWIASIGPMIHNRVEVAKCTGDKIAMTRVNKAQPGCVVEWIFRASPGNPSMGRWGFYRYPDGSIRVWRWLTRQRSDPELCAWMNVDGHWYINALLGCVQQYNPATSALFTAVLGIVIYNDHGRADIQTH